MYSSSEIAEHINQLEVRAVHLALYFFSASIRSPYAGLLGQLCDCQTTRKPWLFLLQKVILNARALGRQSFLCNPSCGDHFSKKTGRTTCLRYKLALDVLVAV